MDKVVFVDIDTQFDFMDPRGKLYVAKARQIVAKLRKLTGFADKSGIPIVSSLDTHIKNDPEFKVFPQHCRKGSPGYKKIKASIAKKTSQVFLAKGTYDIFSNPRSKRIFKAFDTAYVYGVALDYCVKFSCLGLAALGVETYLVRDATRAVSPSGGRETLRLLKGRGVKSISTDSLIRRLACRKTSMS